MQVILIEDLAGKGAAGDTIKVANGYARNFLLPRGIAIPATETNLKTFEHRRAKIAERKDQDKGKAQEIADVIADTSITLQGKSGKGGRLFGAITTQDIVNEINSIHGIYIDKRKVALESPIKQVGVHTVHIRLHAEVIPSMRVLVGTPEEIAKCEQSHTGRFLKGKV
jgi:large subunit ribosomal protein L9